MSFKSTLRTLLALATLGMTAARSMPPRVSAEPAPESAQYRDLVEHALVEYQAKHYPEARALFAQAHKLAPSARTLRGLGLVAYELRAYGESLEYLRAALASTVKPLDPALRTETVRLVERASAFVATLELTLVPADTTVSVDGHPLDTATGVLTLNLGQHALRFAAAGFKSEKRTLAVRGGEHEAWRIELQPDPLAIARSSAPTIKGNVNAKGHKIYHLPSCPDYQATTVDESKRERWFLTERAALEAGFRKAANCP